MKEQCSRIINAESVTGDHFKGPNARVISRLNHWAWRSRLLRYYLFIMFATLGLFKGLSCPERLNCTRANCIYSHSPDLPPPKPLVAPVPTPTSAVALGKTKESTLTVPAKRPAVASPPKQTTISAEPPRKLQKTGTTKKPIPVSTSSRNEVRNPVHHCGCYGSKLLLVGCAYSESQCSPVSGCNSCSPGVLLFLYRRFKN